MDITPQDGISDAERFSLEWSAVKWLTQNVHRYGNTIREYWLDCNTRESPEKAALYQLDKLEACVEALRYERTYPELRERKSFPLSRFYEYTRPKLSCPTLRDTLDKLEAREYKEDPRMQYRLLLAIKGNTDLFDYLMKKEKEEFLFLIDSEES